MSPRASQQPTPRRRAVRQDALAHREQILIAAAELMSERGWNVPIADIAQAAGVGVATLYRAWPDRTALLHALEYRAYEQLIAILEGIEQAGQTGADAVETYLQECVRFGSQLVLPLHGALPLTDETAVDARAQINTRLERFLTNGRADGSVRAKINATDILTFAAMVTQPLPSAPGFRTIARRHVTLYVRGIRADASRPLPGPAVTPQEIEKQLTAESNR